MISEPINRKIRVELPPETAYAAVSAPEHIAEWWCDSAQIEARPGGSGILTWGSRATAQPTTVNITVVEAIPGVRFSFRWLHPDGTTPTPHNSILVTFQLAPDADGTTLLTVTEDGIHEQGWDPAAIEEYRRSHDDGWTTHLARLAGYAARLSRGRQRS